MIRFSTPAQEGVLQASKWLKWPLLLDAAEMEQLFEVMHPCCLYVASEPVAVEKGQMSPSLFLEFYRGYVSALQRGESPDAAELRRPFSAILSAQEESVYALDVGQERCLIRPLQPIIQLQAHHFFPSKVDGSFYSMVLSADSISWGIQFSYPQLYRDPKSGQIVKVTAEHPNSILFHRLSLWARRHTLPTPFLFQGKKTITSIRLGKQCLSWIENHSGLRAQGVQVCQ